MSHRVRDVIKVKIINEQCELCGCMKKLTNHHLIPKSIQDYTQSHRMRLCGECHTWVHQMFSRETLAEHFHTKDSLQEYVELHGFTEPPKRSPAWRKDLKNRLKREDKELQSVINKMVRIR